MPIPELIIREPTVITNNHLLILQALGTLFVTGCIRNSGPVAGSGSSSAVSALPGLTKDVVDKKPKYRLYCAADLASLKSPGKSQLVREFDSLDTGTAIDLSDEKKVSSSSYCLIDVVTSDPSQESLFKWIGKGADGSTMKGVFYRSNAVKISANSLTVTLYRTHELASTGTLDLTAKATFPANIQAKDLKEATLSCGSYTFKSIASKPDASAAQVSSITFSLSKSQFAEKISTCSLSATIDTETYIADSIKIDPKGSVTNHPVTVSVAKVGRDPKTMIIETTIK
jgi:hypothetical protein